MMSSFSNRSYQKELLDGSNIPFADIRQNMLELDRINHHLGGHRITLAAMQYFKSQLHDGAHVVELGCGGGDNLRVIQQWAAQRGLQLQLTGIDINPECIHYARSKKENKGITFICSDYRHADLASGAQIIFSSLFCHHFTDEEIIEMLQWMRGKSSLGYFINDLHRHVVAYQSIRWLTRLFSSSYLVKHDAPLSVRRGFTRKDWQRLFNDAGVKEYSLQWKWAFRWLVIFQHGK